MNVNGFLANRTAADNYRETRAAQQTAEWAARMGPACRVFAAAGFAVTGCRGCNDGVPDIHRATASGTIVIGDGNGDWLRWDADLDASCSAQIYREDGWAENEPPAETIIVPDGPGAVVRLLLALVEWRPYAWTDWDRMTMTG